MAVGLEGYRDEFFADYPDAQRLEAALRTTRNREPLFFFHRSMDPDIRGTWFVLGRLGPELEASLSVRGEVLMAFTAFDDFQRRSYNAIVGRARQELAAHQIAKFGNVRFSPDPSVTLLYSRDPSAAANVTAWNAEGAPSLVAVLPSVDRVATWSRDDVTGVIAEVLASRDLYKGRNPVTGNDFFGRSELIQKLTAELRAGRSVGLFGLRRSGKTSVIRELRRRGEPAGVVTVLADLESLDRLTDAVPQVGDELVNALRRAKDDGRDAWIGPESEHRPGTFAELSNRLVRVAEKNRDFHFVIALDEIENLRRLAAMATEDVRTFLGALRRASQATDNLSLLFTGVTTEFFDQSMLPGDLDNPLFGFVDAVFLRPFTTEESASLVRELGALMMLRWDSEALNEVHRVAGGFPFLVRDLASRVRDVATTGALLPVSRDGAFILVQPAHVLAAGALWKDGASDLWKEIVRTLEAYHPMMAELVRCASDDELADWVATGGEAELAATSLERLGLLRRERSGAYRREGVLTALQDLRGTEAGTLEMLRARRLDADRLAALSSQPEGLHLEFKSTSRYNLHSGKKDPDIESAVVKTVCGFLNKEGGTLLIGVDDAGQIRGIAEDLALCRGSLDQYERWLCGDLLSTRLGAAVIAEHVAFNNVQVEGHQVVEVVVEASASVVWDSRSNGQEALFVRNGNETRELNGRQIADFVSTRSSR